MECRAVHVSPPALCEEYCTCKAKPILDDALRYSMKKLKREDPEWYNAIMGGTEWEILSSDMDKEEPNAAQIIAIALNKRNQVAMSIGHLEILRTLKSLCNPDPVTFAVPYDQVEAALIKDFGSVVKDTAYYNVFRLVIASGGSTSETWNDFFKWADIFIDESRRNVKPETYGILVRYPPRYRNIIKMQLKHTWSQKPPSGSILVASPTSIEHRLADKGGKYAWPGLMDEVESLGHHLAEFTSTVVENNKTLSDKDRARAVVRWYYQVEIEMVGKILAAPKVDPAKLKEQEADMRKSLQNSSPLS